MKNVMIQEELFGKIIKYHLLDQEQEADDIRKGLEKKLDAMVNREVYSKSKNCTNKRRTEELKVQDQMKWVGLMNNIKVSAEEIILKNMVYV